MRYHRNWMVDLFNLHISSAYSKVTKLGWVLVRILDQKYVNGDQVLP